MYVILKNVKSTFGIAFAKSDAILINLSERGDKDIDFVVEHFPIPPKL
jgi:tryptophan synthase beta subunit